MLYEIYIDVFFVVNAMLNFWIIQLVRKIQHYKTTNLRVIVASMAGSFILCVFVCLPFRKYIMVRFLFYVVSFGTMEVVAFPDNKKRSMLNGMLVLYGASLLVNGIYRWLSLEIDNTLQLLSVSILIYLSIKVGWSLCKQKNENQRHIYNVCIVYREQNILLKGLWDTGNRLRSPFHGKGVSVISYQSIQKYVSEGMQKYMEMGKCTDGFVATEEKMFLIPYETVDCKHGLMPVFVAEKMIIQREETTLEYQNPLLGISKTPVSSRDLFQVILTTNGA